LGRVLADQLVKNMPRDHFLEKKDWGVEKPPTLEVNLRGIDAVTVGQICSVFLENDQRRSRGARGDRRRRRTGSEKGKRKG